MVLSGLVLTIVRTSHTLTARSYILRTIHSHSTSVIRDGRLCLRELALSIVNLVPSSLRNSIPDLRSTDYKALTRALATYPHLFHWPQLSLGFLLQVSRALKCWSKERPRVYLNRSAAAGPG